MVQELECKNSPDKSSSDGGGGAVTSVAQECVENDIIGGGGAVDSVVQECQYNFEDNTCPIHNVGLKSVRERKKWVQCKNGLYRNVYTSKKTLVCTGAMQELPSKKTLVPDSGGRTIKSSPDSTPSVHSVGKKRKCGKNH